MRTNEKRIITLHNVEFEVEKRHRLWTTGHYYIARVAKTGKLFSNYTTLADFRATKDDWWFKASL
jgi:hypothetical protein